MQVAQRTQPSQGRPSGLHKATNAIDAVGATNATTDSNFAFWPLRQLHSLRLLTRKLQAAIATFKFRQRVCGCLASASVRRSLFAAICAQSGQITLTRTR